MSEVEWSEEGEEAPKKKRGLPKWLWIGCGGGCLVAIVLVVLAIVFIVPAVRDMANPEKQWPNLEKVMPFDERPEDLRLLMGMPIPFVMDQFVLIGPDESFTATVMSFKSASPAELDQMFSDSGQGAPFGVGAPEDPELGAIEIQGEGVRCLRYSGIGGVPDGKQGPGVRLDISIDGGRVAVVDMRRQGSEDPLSDEEIRAFFAHFDLWRDM